MYYAMHACSSCSIMVVTVVLNHGCHHMAYESCSRTKYVSRYDFLDKAQTCLYIHGNVIAIIQPNICAISTQNQPRTSRHTCTQPSDKKTRSYTSKHADMRTRKVQQRTTIHARVHTTHTCFTHAHTLSRYISLYLSISLSI